MIGRERERAMDNFVLTTYIQQCVFSQGHISTALTLKKGTGANAVMIKMFIQVTNIIFTVSWTLYCGCVLAYLCYHMYHLKQTTLGQAKPVSCSEDDYIYKHENTHLKPLSPPPYLLLKICTLIFIVRVCLFVFILFVCLIEILASNEVAVRLHSLRG